MKPDPENDNLFPPACMPRRIGDLVPQAWKNGGGLTRVIVHHEGWRLSVADITQDGEFSRFPGVRRQIALLTGAGVRLCLSDGTERDVARVGEILTFSGELGADAVLVDGPVQVVNLMHPVSCACRMDVVRAEGARGFDVPAGAAVLIVRGNWVFDGASGQPQTGRAGDFLVLPEGAAGRLRAEEGSEDALLYCIAPA